MRQDARWLADIVVAENKPFQVYDATLYVGKPDLAQYGIKFLPTIGDVWAEGADHSGPGDRNVVANAVSAQVAAGYDIVYFGVESWTIGGSDNDASWASVNKYVDLARWSHEAQPNLKVGHYSRPPYRSYFGATDPNHPEAQTWPWWNDRMKALAGEVDVLFPSLYTFYDNQQEWVDYAEANIAEARRLAPTKPIYPFLWMNYHDSNEQLQYQYVGDKFWRLQLETVANRANGVVIWGGWDFINWQEKVWDDNDPWFVELLDFLNTVDGS